MKCPFYALNLGDLRVRKWMIFICVALLLCGCASGVDVQVEEIRIQLEELPVPGELAKLEQGKLLQTYEHIHTLYGQYRQLTTLQRLQLPEAEEQFETLFTWFREPARLPEEETAAETTAQTVPETILETVPETIPETVPETVPETTAETVPETVPETMAETVPETVSETVPETVPPTTEQEVVVSLSQEDRELLLKLGMAERGEEECEVCIALIMRTVLNRVESGFGSTVRKVIYAQDQFGPAMDGSLETAEPNEACKKALDMVIHGWDESGGALFYEWVQGETWHSRSLKLTAEHCDGQFYKR